MAMMVLQCSFLSEALGMQTGMNVLLPQAGGDDEARNPPYSALLLLHGLSDDHTIWQRRTSIERYADAHNLAVIMPSVDRSFYADMAYGYAYWTFLTEELPALTRRMFPLAPQRERNFVAGLSMGGYGAFKVALSHPDRYAAAASLSGVLDIAGRMQAPDEDDPEVTDDVKLAFGDRDSFAGSDNDVLELARRVAESGEPCPRLYQCCGTTDFLYDNNLQARDRLRELGLDLTYEDGPGDHEWGYWDTQIQKVLDWLPRT